MGRAWGSEDLTEQRKTTLPTNSGAIPRVMTRFSRNLEGHHDERWRKDLSQMDDMKRGDQKAFPQDRNQRRGEKVFLLVTESSVGLHM